MRRNRIVTNVITATAAVMLAVPAAANAAPAKINPKNPSHCTQQWKDNRGKVVAKLCGRYLNGEERIRAMRAAGIPEKDWRKWLAISEGEGIGWTETRHYNVGGSIDYGICQLNLTQNPKYRKHDQANPVTNFRDCLDLYRGRVKWLQAQGMSKAKAEREGYNLWGTVKKGRAFEPHTWQDDFAVAALDWHYKHGVKQTTGGSSVRRSGSLEPTVAADPGYVFVVIDGVFTKAA